MSPGERKNRLGVVESNIGPGIGLMTGPAVLPEVPVMDIILLVAAITLDGSSLHIYQLNISSVAGIAIQ